MIMYVQLDGAERPARIEADTYAYTFEHTAVTSRAHGDEFMVLNKGDKRVAEFLGRKVIGWWIET